MKLNREEIRDLMSTGTTTEDLFEGIEVPDQDIVGCSHRVIARTPREKRDVQFIRTQLLLSQDQKANPSLPLTTRQILQQIGGGPLKPGEWIQIVPQNNNQRIIISGTRGLFILSNPHSS